MYHYDKKGPKRGVSLYSYSAEFGFEKNLEDCFEDVCDMGAHGIEILANTHIENYPYPTQEWVDKWFALLDKYELEPEMIYVTESGQVLLSYGKIQVNVGENEYLNEKIIRLQKIMPQIEGMEGTLHLETWTETTTDIYFEKGQLTEIPNDVQSVPVTEDTSQKDQKSASGGDKKEASEE